MAIDKRRDGERLIAAARGDSSGSIDVFASPPRRFNFSSLDSFASLRVDKLAPNAMAGRSIDRVQRDALAGRRGGVKANGHSYVGDPQKAFPTCSRRQRRPREVLRAA
jgi:hypothetical protein